MSEKDAVLMVISRRVPLHHYEVHHLDRVEFWTLMGGRFGVSLVEEGE